MPVFFQLRPDVDSIIVFGGEVVPADVQVVPQMEGLVIHLASGKMNAVPTIRYQINFDTLFFPCVQPMQGLR